MSDETTKMGVMIRTARKTRGWSGRKLARHAGVSPSTISYIENGQHETTFEVMMRICHALRIDPREIWEPPTGEPNWGAPVFTRDTVEVLATQMAGRIIDYAAQIVRQGEKV